MSGREWQPGDVAAWVVDGKAERIFRYVDYINDNEHAWFTVDSGDGFPKEGELRPLVVIDPEDIPAAKGTLTPTWLRNLARDLARDDRTVSTSLENVLKFLADQIEAQTRPPKPPEPTGLGAVVEDASQVEFIHLGSGLWAYGTTDGPSQGFTYGDIDAVRVLSEGVTA